MRKTIVTVFAVAATALTSCTITTPLTVSEAPLTGNKTGTSSTVVLFGTWNLNSEYGLEEAARNGGIKGGISYADIQYKRNVIFMKKTIIVHGN